jgi:hypothetical protein
VFKHTFKGKWVTLSALTIKFGRLTKSKLKKITAGKKEELGHIKIINT